MSIEKIKGINEDDSYKINLEFPKNKNNKIKVSSLNFSAPRNIFGQRDFSGHVTHVSLEDISESIIIVPYDKNKKNIELNIHPRDYIVEGNWTIKIE